MSTSRHQPTNFWHERFVQQAGWTESIRHKLLGLPEPESIGTVLEVGSGTGAILKDLDSRWPARVMGLDLDLERLEFGKQYAPNCQAVNGDGKQLPLKSDSVDLTVCHFLLLWIDDPLIALREMVRVTRPQGWVMALAEPDYGGRIDYPPQLNALGELQIESLRRQGADPELGRKLVSLFLEAGLSDINAGILGGEWQTPLANPAAREKEWQVLISDLGDMIETARMENLKQDWLKNSRILYVPTFYAWGKTPG